MRRCGNKAPRYRYKARLSPTAESRSVLVTHLAAATHPVPRTNSPERPNGMGPCGQGCRAAVSAWRMPRATNGDHRQVSSLHLCADLTVTDECVRWLTASGPDLKGHPPVSNRRQGILISQATPGNTRPLEQGGETVPVGPDEQSGEFGHEMIQLPGFVCIVSYFIHGPR